ncbi:hypothetical protein [Ureibacillus sp. FSL E2-3493]|uniref:hypothetical protein n=1 Tax=Ureibacillus sp. FSL E2-3493 TaxID=2921367 RepID=UPI003119ED8B
MKKSSIYFWKIIWVIGLLLLTMISFDIENQIKDSSQFNFTPVYWSKFIIYFIWGMYLSLILIKKRSIKFNFPLFICIFVPCFTFSLIVPISASFSISIPFLGVWFLKVIHSGMIEIVAGLTFMLSIFHSGKSDSD